MWNSECQDREFSWIRPIWWVLLKRMASQISNGIGTFLSVNYTESQRCSLSERMALDSHIPMSWMYADVIRLSVLFPCGPILIIVLGSECRAHSCLHIPKPELSQRKVYPNLCRSKIEFQWNETPCSWNSVAKTIRRLKPHFFFFLAREPLKAAMTRSFSATCSKSPVSQGRGLSRLSSCRWMLCSKLKAREKRTRMVG